MFIVGFKCSRREIFFAVGALKTPDCLIESFYFVEVFFDKSATQIMVKGAGFVWARVGFVGHGFG